VVNFSSPDPVNFSVTENTRAWGWFLLGFQQHSFFAAHGGSGHYTVDYRKFAYDLGIAQGGAAEELDILVVANSINYFKDVAAGGLTEGIIG